MSYLFLYMQLCIQLSFKSAVCLIIIFVYSCNLNTSFLPWNTFINLFQLRFPTFTKILFLYSLVKEFMIHGPCGAQNVNCPCMVDNKCSKNFPKNFSKHTSIDQNGFPVYRRKNDGSFVEKSGVQLDNRNVVPYNKYPLKRYQAHINVEWCNQGSSIKYLFKYINKGPDRATIGFQQNNNDCDKDDTVNEIKEYYDCRYLSACEASW
uniref:Uncharacterized protein n=1 Tax=Lactuca sativa TaxID=4236 RepID=A0A9R1WWY7_LACSA|nr:hypothetical protein LSAT_V11C800407680 [Lactuca sativa]